MAEDFDAIVSGLRSELQTLASGGNADSIIDGKKGAPASVRARVGNARTPEDRLATIRQVYPEAIPYDGDNFVFVDRQTGQPVLYNPRGFDVGDVASVAPEVMEGAGATLAGLAAGGATVGTGGATANTLLPYIAAGGAAGRELADISIKYLGGGTADSRSLPRRLLDTATTAGVNAAGQRVVDAGAAGVNRLLRGAADQSAKMRAANVTPRLPSVAVGRDGALAKSVAAVESGIEQLPAARGTIDDAARGMVDDAGREAERIASKYGDAITPEEAGRALKAGGHEALDRIQARIAAMEEGLDDLAPRSTNVNLDMTESALRGPIGRFSSIPEIGQELADPKLSRLFRVISDARENGATLTLGEAREFRSAIGRMLRKPQVLNDIPRADLARVYSALTDDMRAAMPPRARAAFDRVTKFERGVFRRVEGALKNVLADDHVANPEKVFRELVAVSQSGGRSNLKHLWQIRRTLPADEWDTAAAAVIRHMGQAKPGAQNASGDAFSADTFLTNYSKLTAEAKRVLFSGNRSRQELKEGLDRLAEVTETMKARGAMRNHSNTAGAIALQNVLVGAPAMALTGDVATAGSAMVGSMAVPWMTAKAMTNPKFVNAFGKVASSAGDAPASLPRQFARMAIVWAAEPSVRDEVESLADAVRDVDPAVTSIFDERLKRLRQKEEREKVRRDLPRTD